MIQLQALNYILTSKDTSFITLNNLNTDFFSDYPDEFLFIKNHIDSYGNTPDLETFVNKFPNFDVITVTETPKYLLEELYNDKNTRFLAKTFNKIRDLLNEGDTDSAMSLFAKAQSTSNNDVYLNAVDILKDTSRYDDYVDHANDFEKYYIKTGFVELDQIIGGWDRQEELATIVARPNVGKSYLLLKIALAAAEQGLTVGIYSGEMSERKVGYRLDTLRSHLSNTKLIRGNLSIQNDYKRYIDNIRNEIPGSIKVLTPAMIGGPAGVSALRAFIAKEHLDILCVYQHSLLADDRKAKSPIEKAANISKDLKNLQVLKHIPIIAVSQQNRESTENGVSVSHIAQSDRIGQDSTAVIFLEQDDNNVLTLELVKSRDSVNGKKLKYAVDFDKGIFTYIPNEKDALNGSTCEQIRDEYEYVDTSEDNVF